MGDNSQLMDMEFSTGLGDAGHNINMTMQLFSWVVEGDIFDYKCVTGCLVF